MSATRKAVTPSTANLTFAEKRALLKNVQAPAREPSGLRDATIALVAGAPVAVRSFWDDLKTEYNFREELRRKTL